jgi:omega-6 fatty acid desaturase (delta-12 desaturase)
MYISLDFSYWLTLLLAVPAAGFLIRIFIIFHDCGHGSYFKSRKLNTFFGYLTGILAFVPYHHWNHRHAQHHATASDLDRRGVGDVWTLTVKEYLALPKKQQIIYKLHRHPVIMLLVGPIYVFLINNRFVDQPASPLERRGVYITNLGILFLAVISSLTIGFEAYFLIQFPVIFMAAAAGIWLFYVQHQFEDVYWARHESWSYQKAALNGSSFYKLPAVLRWFSGNIGFHHIHHLNSKIPNYRLPECHDNIPELAAVKPLTIRSSLKSLRLRLWDEDRNCLIPLKHVGFQID